MSTYTSRAVRCPRCSAQVRAGSDWCTLCYADMRPAPPEPDPESQLVEPEVRAEASPDQVEPAAVRRGKHARRAPAPDGALTADGLDVERLADQLVAELAAAETRNPLGPLAGALDTQGKRVALMVGGTVAAMCLIFVVMAVVGALL